jgi:hypothetical protein
MAEFDGSPKFPGSVESRSPKEGPKNNLPKRNFKERLDYINGWTDRNSVSLGLAGGVLSVAVNIGFSIAGKEMAPVIQNLPLSFLASSAAIAGSKLILLFR